MFGINDGCDPICVWHKFKVGVFDIVLFDVGAMMLISIAGIGFDVKIVVKLLFKIVVQNCCNCYCIVSKLVFPI